MSEKRFVPNNYKTSAGNTLTITDTTLKSNKELTILDLSDNTRVDANSYMYDREISFGKANYISNIATTNSSYSVTLTIKLNRVDFWSSCNLRFIKLKITNGFGVKQNNTTGKIDFGLYIKLVDLNNDIIEFSNSSITPGPYVGMYTLISRTVTSSSPINAGSWDGTFLIDLADMTIKPYTNDLLLKALCVKDILSPNGDSLTQTINPSSALSDFVANAFLNNTYIYQTVGITNYPEYLGIHNTCTFNIYDKNYSTEDILSGNAKILTPEDTISVAGTNSLNYTTYNLYIKQSQPINDVCYFRFILTTINGVPKFKNVSMNNCTININFQFGDGTDIRTYTFRAIIEPGATFVMPTQFLVDIQENKYLPFAQTTISANTVEPDIPEDLLNYVIDGPFIDKPAADYIVEPISDWDNENEGDL